MMSLQRRVAESRGLELSALASHEASRIEGKPLDQIRGSLARKMDSDLVTVPTRCHHERLDEEGICRACGKDCRGIG